jgi:hypothetical protein
LRLAQVRQLVLRLGSVPQDMIEIFEVNFVYATPGKRTLANAGEGSATAYVTTHSPSPHPLTSLGICNIRHFLSALAACN